MKRQTDDSLESIRWSKLGRQNEQDAMGAYTSASWLWIKCECGGIVRNDIFPDTLPYTGFAHTLKVVKSP